MRGRSEGWRLWGDFEGQDWYGQALNFETKYLGPKVDTTVTSTTETPETLSELLQFFLLQMESNLSHPQASKRLPSVL